MQNNAWKAYPFPYELTESSVLSFDFKSTLEGELHEIGLDTDLQLRNGVRFQVFGTQVPRDNVQDYNVYPGEGIYQSFNIPIGQYSTGPIELPIIHCRP